MSSLAKIPVTVITGFLGSGKTTLIRHLMSNPGGRKLAVLVNDTGCRSAHRSGTRHPSFRNRFLDGVFHSHGVRHFLAERTHRVGITPSVADRSCKFSNTYCVMMFLKFILLRIVDMQANVRRIF